MPSSQQHTERDPSEVMYRGCMGLLGVGMMLGFFVAAGYTLWTGLTLVNLGLAGFFLLLALGGTLMLRAAVLRGRRDTSAEDDADPMHGSRQRGVLRTARKLEGRLTLAEVSLHTRLDVAEAREVLDEFERHGIAEMQISDSGQEVYVFPAFTDGGRDKLTATSVLDEDDEVELLFDQLEEELAAKAEEEEAAQAVPSSAKHD